MIIRNADISDVEAIFRVFYKSEFFLSNIRGHSARIFKARYGEILLSYLKMLEKDKNIRFIIAEEESGKPIGYFLLQLDSIESITGVNQAYIKEFAVDRAYSRKEILGLLFEEASIIASRENLDYIAVEMSEGDTDGVESLVISGFTKEICRLIKKVEKYDKVSMGHDLYIIRRACNSDIFFILWLNAQCGSFTIPEGRSVLKSDVMLRYMNVYADLVLEDDELIALIIEEKQQEKSAGYLLIKTDSYDFLIGENVAYIYDLSIHPDYWGKRATHRIIRQGENILKDKGINFVIADISSDNQRALKTALKSLNFQIESARWVKNLAKYS